MADVNQIQVWIDKDYENGMRHLRSLISLVAPQCDPSDSLMGLVSQIDNYIAGVRHDLEKLNANPDEPAWVTRFAKGKADCSPFVAKEIADQVRELLIYKRAMESMAKQFIHPKITAREMAEMQLK